ncbi:MAG: 50S ribosomal protein L1 [Phycisphaerales bacterium]|jgi:large subunit ribosomal protein L1|nr:50S ribosomal protein L1 [Phycisphaerales bacterium]MBT7170316.1 50S ribosomal protein L1 [Phycisphaerales bacterium]
MAKRYPKRYGKALEMQPADKLTVAEAVKTIKAYPAPKFDQSVELCMHLGIDPRQADQALRGSLSLPHGIGKTKKVIAFCDEGSAAEAALAAGATEAGLEELVDKVAKGWMDFDVAIAHPAAMRVVSKLGRALGPSGKMPSPKAGTVSPDVATAVKEFAAGKLEYRNDDFGNLHVVVGKCSFDEQQLIENIEFFVKFVKKSKPATTKGHYIKKISLSASMTPSAEIAEF